MPGGSWGILTRIDGNASGDTLGVSLSSVPDISGDGLPEIVAGAPSADPHGMADAGTVYVIDGVSGSILLRMDGIATYDRLGSSVDGGEDVDLDGVPDIAAGASYASPNGLFEAGSALVFSGATGAVLWRMDGGASGDRFGASVAIVGDVDGDGHADFLVGAPNASPNGVRDAGTACCYSGATGALLYSWTGGIACALGFKVAASGDVDRDGSQDFLISAPGTDVNGLQNAGEVTLVSGSTGALIHTFAGTAVGQNLGHALSGGTDLDGDGVPDLLLGAPLASPNGVTYAGLARLCSGSTGSLIHEFRGAAYDDLLGYSVSFLGDVDGDGFPEISIGAVNSSPAGVYKAGALMIYSGRDRKLLWSLPGEYPKDQLGFSVCALGDIDLNSTPDVAVGAPTTDPGGFLEAGSIFVFSLSPFLVAFPAELSATVGTSVSLSLDFPASEAGFSYSILASGAGTGPTIAGGLEIPLSLDRVMNRMLSGWTPPILRAGRGTLDPNGDAQAVLNGHPALAPAIGRTIYLAAVSYNSATMTGRLSSIARYLTIVP